MTIYLISRHVSRRMLAGIAFMLFSLVAAQAGSIFTPLIIVQKDGEAVCIANNASQTVSVTLTVQLISTIFVDASKSCTMAAAADFGCVLKKKFTRQTGVKCIISMSGLTNAEVLGRVRGILYLHAAGSISPSDPEFVVRAR